MSKHMDRLLGTLRRRDGSGERVHSDADIERVERALLFTLLEASDPVPAPLARACEDAARALGFRRDDSPERLATLLDEDFDAAADADGLRADLERVLEDLVSGALTPEQGGEVARLLGQDRVQRPVQKSAGGIGGGPLAAMMLQGKVPTNDGEE